MGDRLDKIISSIPEISRAKAKKVISSGRVTVDGKVIKQSKEHVNPNESIIKIDGIDLVYKKYLYILQNKPLGIVSATNDPECQTVIDILPSALKKQGLFPAGRLDKYSEGMMIITNDGDFAHRMLAPKNHVPKTYYVEVDNPIVDEKLKELFSKGVYLGGDEYSSPAMLEIVSEYSANVTIFEGIYHQVRRMFDQNGGKVQRLKRIKIGNLILDDNLALGNSRELTKLEFELLGVER